MKTWKSFVKRNIEWMILSAVLFFLHVLYLFLIGRTGDDLIYAVYHYGCRMHGIYPLLPKSAVS